MKFPASGEAVFNTPIECGLRSTALLLAAYPRACDLQRLVQYDYLIVHSGDVDGGPPSIHPDAPHRSGELLVRRSLVEQGLEFMTQRSVVERIFTEEGVGYVAGEYAAVFLSALNSEYTLQLMSRAEWVIARFRDMPDPQFTEYMRNHWSEWGAEFLNEALLNMID